MEFKKKIKSGSCAAAKCRQPAVEGHSAIMNDPDPLCFCAKHGIEARNTYGEGDGIIIAPLKPATPTAGGTLGLPDDKAAKLSKEIEVAHQEANEAIELVRAFEIRTAEDMKFAEEEKASVKAQWKHFEAQRVEATGPMNKALKVINGWFKPVQTVLKEMEGAWNDKLRAHARAQAAEQQRLIAEARAAEAPVEIRENLVAASASVPQTTMNTFVDKWVFEITDPEKIPAEFLSPDLKKIGTVVAQLKDKTAIPGVRAWNEMTVKQKAT